MRRRINTESVHYFSPWCINRNHLLSVYQGAISIRLLLGPLTLKQTRTPVAHGMCTYMHIYMYEYTSMSTFPHALILSYRIRQPHGLEKCSMHQNSNAFNRGQFWPPGIVVACVCPSVRRSVQPSVTKFVGAITRDLFKLGSPNLDQRCKRPWLRSLLYFGAIDLDHKVKFNLKVRIYAILSLSTP